MTGRQRQLSSCSLVLPKTFRCMSNMVFLLLWTLHTVLLIIRDMLFNINSVKWQLHTEVQEDVQRFFLFKNKYLIQWGMKQTPLGPNLLSPHTFSVELWCTSSLPWRWPTHTPAMCLLFLLQGLLQCHCNPLILPKGRKEVRGNSLLWQMYVSNWLNQGNPRYLVKRYFLVCLQWCLQRRLGTKPSQWSWVLYLIECETLQTIKI